MLYNLFENRDFVSVFAVALLAEGVDRNFDPVAGELRQLLSPSSRRAWIEIRFSFIMFMYSVVALLAEGVDRNRLIVVMENAAVLVALLAEGVDRNLDGPL